MSLALLEPPATEEQLRERAAGIAEDVEAQLLPAVPERVERREARLAARQAFFADLRRSTTSVARSSAWRTHELTTELLLLVDQLRDAIEVDIDATDPAWHVREALQRILVVLRAMVRQLMHDAMDRPEQAAPFVAQALADVEVAEVARLLGTSPRMVSNYRRGQVGQIRKEPNRLTLVGQLVYELHGSMTPRGVLLWFDAPMPALGGCTPRQLLDEDAVAHRHALMALARGGRAQTDRGGARRGALDLAA